MLQQRDWEPLQGLVGEVFGHWSVAVHWWWWWGDHPGGWAEIVVLDGGTAEASVAQTIWVVVSDACNAGWK